MRYLICIFETIIILAGLNLGFVGFFDVNPLELMIKCPMTLSLIYALVGFSALVLAIAKACGACLCGCTCSCGCKCKCDSEAKGEDGHKCCCKNKK